MSAAPQTREELRDLVAEQLILLGFDVARGALLPLIRDVLVPWFRDLLAAGVDPPYALGVAAETILSIDDDPTYESATDTERATVAREAIRLQLTARGGIPSDSDLNRWIELAYRLAQDRRSQRGGG